MNLKRWLSCLLVLVMVFSLSANAFAAVPDPNMPAQERFPHRYSENGIEMTKISHPDKPANTRDAEEKFADGLLDYVPGGVLGVPGVDAGADGQGDRGQSYSWGSIAYGDWMYVSTLYNAMFSTMQLAPAVGHSFSPDVLEKVAEALYRGDFFIEEPDGGNPRCALAKINVKTGEVKILMSTALNGISGQFRNAVEYHDKLYFCGSPNGIPSIWEIDPKTDAFRRAYVDPAAGKDPSVIRKAIQEKGLSIAIRGMTVFNDYLVISCVGPDANPYIAVSNDPDKGFTVIASAWKEGTDNTVKGELLGYPACHLKDSIYGGHIWEMIPFNNKLYVSICTGTPQNSPDGGKTMQSFALMRGECPSGNIADRSAWTWTPVAGDPEDGAAYPFGLDAQRTRAGACTMRVFGDHLYIGEYNDAEIGMMNMMFGLDMQFLADNLEQSVNLYRMGADEKIEMVVGDPTEQFPESLSGLRSGFGETETVYENQYIWRMETMGDKLYLGTFDQGSLLYPIAQFSNGDILHMSAQEWMEQLEYLRAAIEAILKDQQGRENPGPNAVGTAYDTELLEQLLAVQEEVDALRSENRLNAQSVPSLLNTVGKVDSLPELHRVMAMLPELLAPRTDLTVDEQILIKEQLYQLLTELLDYLMEQAGVPDFVMDIYKKLLNEENILRIYHAVRCLGYLKNARQGFDMFVTEDGVNFDVITRNGLGDPYNQGLRALTIHDTEENPWLCAGTANPFYGTQIWRMEGTDLNPEGYPIYTEQSANGRLIAPETGYAGETAEILAETADGYQVMNLKATDENGNPVAVERTNAGWQFVMPEAPVSVTAFFTRFLDLENSEYYMDAVEWGTENRVIMGMRLDAFGPEEPCTRAHAVTFLWRNAGCPEPAGTVNPFADVPEEEYYYHAVLWALENGVTVGVSDTEFAPDRTCTREEIVTMLWRSAGSLEAESSESPFTDVPAGAYFAQAVAWAAENGIVMGTAENTFSPEESCTRAQIVSFLYRGRGD